MTPSISPSAEIMKLFLEPESMSLQTLTEYPPSTMAIAPTLAPTRAASKKQQTTDARPRMMVIPASSSVLRILSGLNFISSLQSQF